MANDVTRLPSGVTNVAVQNLQTVELTANKLKSGRVDELREGVTAP